MCTASVTRVPASDSGGSVQILNMGSGQCNMEIGAHWCPPESGLVDGHSLASVQRDACKPLASGYSSCDGPVPLGMGLAVATEQERTLSAV